YTGGDAYPYIRHHNPFSYFSDVVNSSVQKLNLVPFTHFAADLANNQLPNLSFVVPNMHDIAHDCPAGMSTCSDAQKLAAADSWLKTHIAPLISNPAFQKDGILVIVFDEAFSGDTTHGGGHVAAVVVGPQVKGGFKSTNIYQHQSLLRTLLAALGVSSYPGAAATAPAMSDMFTSAAPTPTPTPTPTPSPAPTPSPSGCTAVTNGVTVCSPVAGSSVGSPVRFTAAAKSVHPITAIRIYIDNVSAYFTRASTLDAGLPVSPGSHNVVVQAWDSAGTVWKTPLTISVRASSGTPCSASSIGVTVCTPTAGTTLGSPVNIRAAAKSLTGEITAMRIYVDSISQYFIRAASINTSLALTSGKHFMVLQAWDSAGAVFKTPVSITVQ
ncbi:MAG: alkaline phosphatase family protein, partial [Candidatus Angelobacter sp.]